MVWGNVLEKGFKRNFLTLSVLPEKSGSRGPDDVLKPTS